MKLSDLMTTGQALKTIEILKKILDIAEDLTKRVENLENEVENLKAIYRI